MLSLGGGGGCVSRIISSMNTSTYSKGGPPVSCEEALSVCSVKCRVVGRDICAVPGQVAELVVVGCSTTSSADCSSVAVNVVAGISHFRASVWGVRRTCSVCRRCRCDRCVIGISSIRMWVWRVLQTVSRCRYFRRSICDGFVAVIWSRDVALGDLSVGQVCYGLCDRTECQG